MIENQKVLGRIPEPQYRKMEGLAQSDLTQYLKSPRHFELREHIDRDSDEMAFGTMFHMAFLEPARFKESYIIAPQTMPNGEMINRRSSKHREYLEAFQEDNLDKIVCSEKDMELLTAMLNEMARTPLLRELFNGGQSECTATWDYRGLKCKGRADYFTAETLHGRVVLDLKTSQHASHDKFARSIHNYAYDCQSAWYRDGFQADKFLFVVIEKSKYPGIGIYDGDLWYELGKRRLDRCIDRHLECVSKNHWPSYTEGIELIKPPSWLAAQDEEQI